MRITWLSDLVQEADVIMQDDDNDDDDDYWECVWRRNFM